MASIKQMRDKTLQHEYNKLAETLYEVIKESQIDINLDRFEMIVIELNKRGLW